MVDKKISQNGLKNTLQSTAFNMSSILIPIFQYIPCASIWFGIMSIPLITYLFLFFQNPSIFIHDFMFFFGYPGTYITLIGLTFSILSIIYQLRNRKYLTVNGPYKYIRHPQYVGFILMTFGLTLITIQTDPVHVFNQINGHMLILFIWIAQVIAYIVLAKIEEFALKAKYGDIYLNYVDRVPFMFPFLKLRRK